MAPKWQFWACRATCASVSENPEWPYSNKKCLCQNWMELTNCRFCGTARDAAVNKGKDKGKKDVAWKGKGGGKGAPKGKNNKSKLERIENKLWKLLEQDERERYKQHLLQPGDARRLARQRQKT